jgi:hypothetical protein
VGLVPEFGALVMLPGGLPVAVPPVGSAAKPLIAVPARSNVVKHRLRLTSGKFPLDNRCMAISKMFAIIIM